MKIPQIAPRMDRDVIQREYENLSVLDITYIVCSWSTLYKSNYFLKITFFSNAGHQRLFMLVSMDLGEPPRKNVIKYSFNEIQN